MHPRAEDINVFLESPDGTMVELLTDVSGHENNFMATRLDDEATESISLASAPFSSQFQPEDVFRDFAGT